VFPEFKSNSTSPFSVRGNPYIQNKEKAEKVYFYYGTTFKKNESLEKRIDIVSESRSGRIAHKNKK
jgi:hypothetical protein